MARPMTKSLAEAYRRQGLSYSEIMQRLEEDGEKTPSLSTLGRWLSGIKLTAEQQRRLDDKITTGGEKGIRKMHRIRGILRD